MKQTLLYYPDMVVSNPRLLRQAILYWDEIGSIVPMNYGKAIFRNNPDFEILSEFGLYRFFSPDEYVQRNEKISDEFITIIESPEFINASTTRPSGNKAELYSRKFNLMLISYLAQNGHAILHGNKVEMNRKSALLYMSLLAKYLANDDRTSITTPVTDYKAYLDLSFSTPNQDLSLPGILISMNNILPSPHDNVSIKKIIDFKEKRKSELFRFRQIMTEYQNGFKHAGNQKELFQIADGFSSKIKIEVEQLDRLFTDSKIPVVLGALENLLKIETPTFIAGLAAIGTIPISLTIAGAIVAGSITLTKYHLDIRNTHHEKLASNSFSYLYSAQQEGIIDRP